MEQWELERLRKRYERRLNDTLRMAPHEDNVQDACDSVCQYALWKEFPETPSVSVVDVRTFRVPLGRFGLLYSGRPDELILESDFDYYQARNILRNSFSSVPLRGVRGIIETKYLIVNPDSKNPDSKAMARWFTGEGSGSLISLVNSGYLSREDLIQIGKRLSPKVPRGTEIFYSRDISITVTSNPLDKFNSMEISYRNGKKQDVDLYQLDGYLLDSYLLPGLDCVLWTNGLCWKIFYKAQLWEDIVLDPGKAYVETDESGRPLNMPIQIGRSEFDRLVEILKSMYHKL